MASSRSVEQLCAMFTGTLPEQANWDDLLLTANRGWIAPALYVSLAQNGRLAELPTPVRDYLEFLHDSNLQRNLNLRAQLLEAAVALNRHGLVPVLLKGAIDLAAGPPDMLGFRMISDLDLSFAPDEIGAVRSVLEAIGYTPTFRSNEMARAQDAGTVELHDRPRRRSAPFLDGDLRAASSLLEVDGAELFIPAPTARAQHLIVHDMIKEGDLWRLRLDLRHLLDLSRLATSPPGIDWEMLRTALHGRTGRRALEATAVAVHQLFGVPVPTVLKTRRAAWRHSAALVASEPGMPGWAARTAGNLRWGIQRLIGDGELKRSQNLWSQVRRTFTVEAAGSRL